MIWPRKSNPSDSSNLYYMSCGMVGGQSSRMVGQLRKAETGLKEYMLKFIGEDLLNKGRRTVTLTALIVIPKRYEQLWFDRKCYEQILLDRRRNLVAHFMPIREAHQIEARINLAKARKARKGKATPIRLNNRDLQ